MTAALEGGEWSASRPGRPLPTGKTRYPLYRGLGGPQGRSGREENLAPPGFHSRTVQPGVQSLYRLSYPAHIPVLREKNLKKQDNPKRCRYEAKGTSGRSETSPKQLNWEALSRYGQS